MPDNGTSWNVVYCAVRIRVPASGGRGCEYAPCASPPCTFRATIVGCNVCNAPCASAFPRQRLGVRVCAVRIPPHAPAKIFLVL